MICIAYVLGASLNFRMFIFYREKMEKENWQVLTYLWTFGGYTILTQWEENIVAKSDENGEWYAVMNTWMFHKQTHLCKTRKELWRKIKHNKDAKKLCQIFNRDFV